VKWSELNVPFLIKANLECHFYGSRCTKKAKLQVDSLILITARGKNTHVKFWRSVCFYYLIENKTDFMILSLPLR